ncbi:MAG TPA: hypothetical protein EYP85_14365 [Armatimonadetes bacterium]|nr:hypothetical protein [Armatimonadota bacterium]
MKQMRRIGWSAFVAAALAALLLYVWWAARQEPQVADMSSPPQLTTLAPAAVYYDYTEIIRDRSDRIVWKLHARKLVLLKDGSCEVYGLERGEYFQEEEVLATIQADYARYNDRTKNILVQGNISIVSPRGLVFETDELRWLDREQKLVCPALKRARYTPPQKEGTPIPVVFETRRLYFFVNESRLECPDPVRLTQVPNLVTGRQAAVDLKSGVFTIAGPAGVTVLARLEEGFELATREQKGDETVKKIEARLETGGVLEYRSKTKGFAARPQVVFRLPEDDLTIFADQVDYSGKPEEVILARGHLRIVAPENELTGKEVSIYGAEKRAEISGSVRLIHTPRRKPREALEREWEEYRYAPTTLTCDRLVYFYGEGQRRGQATGNLRVEQKGRWATAQEAIFDQEARVVELKGGVKVQGEEGERLSARVVRLFLEEERVVAEGPVELEFYLTEEEQPESSPAQRTPAPPPRTVGVAVR